MPINFPANRKEVIDRIKTDVQGQLPESDPFLRNSFIQSLMVGYGGRVFEIYLQMKEMLLELFPDTASGQYLSRWGTYVDITENASTPSSGYITAIGMSGNTISTSDKLQSQNGNEYSILEGADTADNTNTITSLTFSAGTVTAVTTSAHKYASGISVTISGAVESDYNGTFTIFVTGENSFTYEIDGSPSSPATGSPMANAITATLLIQSDGFGSDQNLESGATLTFTTPISGVDSTAYVQFGGVEGGTDVETTEDFRSRVISEYQHPSTPFNSANIETEAKKVNGVTRVFVYEPDMATGSHAITSITQSNNIAVVTTSSPHGLISGMYVSISGATQVDYNLTNVPILVMSATVFIYIVQNNPTSPATGTIVAAYAQVQPGQTKVIFTRDNDPSIIPTGIEVAQVKTQLLKIKPAHMAEVDLIVAAPVAVPVDFVFDELVPNTASMQDAVTKTLQAFFRQETLVGENLLEKAYLAAIYSTVDTVTGESIQNFNLTSPTGDVTINDGEIPTLGSISF